MDSRNDTAEIKRTPVGANYDDVNGLRIPSRTFYAIIKWILQRISRKSAAPQSRVTVGLRWEPAVSGYELKLTGRL